MNDLTQTPEMLIATMGARARRAAVTIAQASDAQKADALRRAAQAVRDQAPAIIAAN
ncbi:MAG: gamma-glutamyl-phosphate reductase, partial [Pseudomonadota bacterium]|nr:gamma-glutamyl-phosphate reductase [Pseudomonadota bacterium]